MILVSVANILHHHAFSRPFHAKIFVPRCQRRYFNQTFYQSHYPNGIIACGLCFIWQPSFVENYSACCRHSVHVFFFNSYHALKLNHRDQTEVSSEGLFKNPYTFTYFRHNLEPRAFWYRSCAREGPGKICSRDSTNSGYFSNLALLRLR